MTYKINPIAAPLSVQMELTYGCNNACLFCYNVWKSPEKKQENKPVLRFMEIKKIMDKLKHACIFKLSYTGGEPTLHPDFLDILQYGTNIGLNQSFVTNANLVDDDFAGRIKDSGVYQCQVSLHSADKQIQDSLTQVAGSYEKVIRGIRSFIKHGFSLNINMTVIKKNLNEIFKTASLAKELGAGSFTITRYVNAGYGLTHLNSIGVEISDLEFIVDEIVRVEKELGMNIKVLTPIPLCSLRDPSKIVGKMSKCDGGISWCAISPSGDVRYCTNMDEVAGNLLEQDLETIWQQGIPFQKCRNLTHVPDECKACFAFQFCGGGCRASSYNYSRGDAKAPDPCSQIRNYLSINQNMPGIIKQLDKERFNIKTGSIDELFRNSLDELIPVINGKLMVRNDKPGLIASTNGMKYAVINEDGLAFLKKCDGKSSIRKIINVLAGEYRAEAAKIEKGIIDFSKYITQMELLNWIKASGA